LLHGVTGSGKTAVYLAAMQRALDRGEGSILLVPEIGLTPQTAGLLDAAFGQKVALLHSALTPEERSEQWRRIRRGDAPIVVGTRSAIFAPRSAPGPDRGRRGARPKLQAGGDAALQRPRCGRGARQAGGRSGGHGFGHAVSGKLAELESRASISASKCASA
jgi:superfamily II DNA/RNA helicase